MITNNTNHSTILERNSIKFFRWICFVFPHKLSESTEIFLSRTSLLIKIKLIGLGMYIFVKRTIIK